MPLRCEISAVQVAELHARLARQLDDIGVESQPKVALRLIQLSRRPESQLRDFADVIKTDWALTGRLMRLANSALFAQRTPVTKLERAVVLLGIDRVKAVSLGFYLSRAAAAGGARALSRQVWGQSVYRACLAAALARARNPEVVSEAFVVGLMLDCGIPLMARLAGEEYEQLHARAATPTRLYELEHSTLEFTHVDVAAVLMRRWRIPSLLARPITWHHLPPSATAEPRTDAAAALHRLACYAGAVTLGPDELAPRTAPLPTAAANLLQLGPAELAAIVRTAAVEYEAISKIFTSVAAGVGDLDAFVDSVQHQLIEALDAEMARAIYRETAGGPKRLEIAGLQIELEPAGAGQVVAYIDTAAGERIIACTLRPRHETPASLKSMLGLDDASEQEIAGLMDSLRKLAA